MDSTYYTTTQVAKKLNVSRNTVYNYIARKKLDSVKLGHHTVRIPASALHRFIESKKQ
jgi:excisionase family DNA binding protein|tara:strand:+ start:340 stop:513 length:174 start_codon:yes stop_codon:yes gene_type:complete